MTKKTLKKRKKTLKKRKKTLKKIKNLKKKTSEVTATRARHHKPTPRRPM